jgi:excisionase family DNA binding protein
MDDSDLSHIVKIIARLFYCCVGKLATLGNLYSSSAKGETMAELEGEILTLDEVAVYLKAGKRTVYRLVAESKLPAFKLGGTWRFRKADLGQWIAQQITRDCQRGGKA